MPARLVYEGSFSTPGHLGIKKGFFQKLKEKLTGSTSHELGHPMAVLTANSTFYVADTGMKGVHIFDTARGDYRFVAGSSDNRMVSPVGLARGPQDKVFVSDSSLGKVFVIDPDEDEASVLALQSSPNQPTGIAVDVTRNRLFVTDTAAHEVLAYSLDDGALIDRFGGRGTEPGSFNFPTMIWLDSDNNLLINDSLNFRIQLFSDQGTYLDHFGNYGNGTGDLFRPKSVAVDGMGHVYVTDSVFHVFQVFSRAGDFLLGVGRQGHGPGEFWMPAGIFVEDDMIYVCDSYNGRVQMFRILGNQ